MEKKHLFKNILFGGCFILLCLILTLSFKIIRLFQERKQVLGSLSIIDLNADNLIFDNQNTALTYFYEPEPNSDTLWSADWLNNKVINKINSDSLNDRFEYSQVTDKKTYRIIAIGDSYTYGLYVPTSESFPEVLEDTLNARIKCEGINHFEVINLGVPGYDIQYTVERFLKRGLKYNPDLVIWLLNDWNFDKISELYYPLEEKYIKDSIPLFDKVSRKYKITEEFKKSLASQYSEKEIFEFQEKQFLRLFNNYKDKLLVLSFHNLQEKYKTIIKNFVHLSPNFIYFESLTDLWRNGDMVFLDFHPNKVGHEQISKNIFEYIVPNYLTNCRVFN